MIGYKYIKSAVYYDIKHGGVNGMYQYNIQRQWQNYEDGGGWPRPELLPQQRRAWRVGRTDYWHKDKFRLWLQRDYLEACWLKAQAQPKRLSG